jgi:hypothetical protein
MRVTWKVEGAGGWSKSIQEDISIPPIEIATKVIELVNEQGLDCELGLILMVTHDQMKSVDQTYICHVPTVLANAGLYEESARLQNAIDNLLKH